MAERLHPINVGYRPLSPADDVSGLASQRQAVQEFEAKSMDAARSANATQQAINAGLKAHETFATLAQNAQSLTLEREKARHTMDMQQSELLMEQRLMPLKLESLALANDAQAIDNEYAYIEKDEEIEAKRLENEMRIDALDEAHQKRLDFANVAAYEKAKRNWVKSERDPDDFVWGGTRGNSRESRMAFDDADRRIKAESRTKEIDAETDALSGKFQLLDDGERDIFDKKDSLADGGGFTYRTKDGKAFNARGKDLLDRMDRQRELNLTHDEKVELREGNLARLRASGVPGLQGRLDDYGDSGRAAMGKLPEWYREFDGGEMVLTEAGIREFEDRRLAVAPKFSATTMIVDGVTSVRAGTRFQKAKAELLKAFNANTLNAGKTPDMAAINAKAKYQVATDGRGMETAQIMRLLTDGDPVYVMRNGKPDYLYIDTKGTARTDDDTVEAESGSGGGSRFGGGRMGSLTPAEGERLQLANLSYDNQLQSAEEGKEVRASAPALKSTRENIPHAESYAKGHTVSDWNKSPFVKIEDYRAQLLAPTDQLSPYDSDGTEKGYAATDAEADEIITLIKANALKNGLTARDNSSLRQQLNWAVDYYSDEHVEPLRKQLAALLGMDDVRDPRSKFVAQEHKGSWFPVAAPQSGNQVSARESDEIISTEIGDSTVKLGDGPVVPAKLRGKVMTIREFVKLPAAQMANARLQIPWAEENWMDAGTPNEPTEGNIHAPGRRKRKPLGVTLYDYKGADNIYKGKLGSIKATLEQIIKHGDELKRLGKFVRYEEGEYN